MADAHYRMTWTNRHEAIQRSLRIWTSLVLVHLTLSATILFGFSFRGWLWTVTTYLTVSVPAIALWIFVRQKQRQALADLRNAIVGVLVAALDVAHLSLHALASLTFLT